MPSKLKIAHIVRQYHPSAGGLENYVAQLAQRQSERHRVYIITLNRLFGSKATLRSVERSGRVIIIRVPYIGVREFFIPFLSLKLLDRFDLQHVHATDQLLDVLWVAKRFRNLMYFVTTHGLFFHTTRLRHFKRLYLHVVTRRSLSRSEAVFAVSDNDAYRRTRQTSVPLADALLSPNHLWKATSLSMSRLSASTVRKSTMRYRGK